MLLPAEDTDFLPSFGIFQREIGRSQLLYPPDFKVCPFSKKICSEIAFAELSNMKLCSRR